MKPVIFKIVLFFLLMPLVHAGTDEGAGRTGNERPGGQAQSSSVTPAAGISRTFSIVAVDPETGICGAAVASKYPKVGRVVPAARAGVGAFCTQYWHNPDWREEALDRLEAGSSPTEVVADLLDADDRVGRRQIGLIDIRGRTAQHNPINADLSGYYWGAFSGRYYACQGNTLTGRTVITSMAEAYERTDGSLTDRLMAALVAGDCAGGDHRGRLAAGIVVAKPGEDGYWLELYVHESDDAVIDLLKKYTDLTHPAKGEWSVGRAPFEHPCPNRPQPQAPSTRKSEND